MATKGRPKWPLRGGQGGHLYDAEVATEWKAHGRCIIKLPPAHAWRETNAAELEGPAACSHLISISSVLGINGYNSVATYSYAFNSLIDYIRRQQDHLVNVKNIAEEMLKPGIKPSELYTAVMENIHPEIQGIFMGIGDEVVEHLGRGVGLTIDEYPKLSKDNQNPLVENMVVTLNFFAALEGYGTTVLAHTYIVTTEGGVSINGSANDVIVAGKYL